MHIPYSIFFFIADSQSRYINFDMVNGDIFILVLSSRCFFNEEQFSNPCMYAVCAQ